MATREAPDPGITDGRRRAGAQTRARLLEAASELLASGGEQGLNLRAVSEAAGANVAAVKYHFGSREQLITEVIEGATRQVTEAQLAALEALADGAEAASATAWVEAWARPLVQVAIGTGAEDRQLGRIISQAHAAPLGDLDVKVRDTTSAPSELFLRGLGEALPEVSRADLQLRFALMASAIAGFATGAFESALAAAEPGRDLEGRILGLLVAIAASEATGEPGAGR